VSPTSIVDMVEKRLFTYWVALSDCIEVVEVYELLQISDLNFFILHVEHHIFVFHALLATR
jgi:hypothetical protein